MRLLRRIPLRFLLIFVAFASVLPAQGPVSAPPSAADQWSTDVRAFADNIAAALGLARSVFLAVKNISSIDAAGSSFIEQELESELTQRGFLMVPAASAASQLDVTLSENVDGYLWIAENRGRTGGQTVITAVRRPHISESGAHPAPLLRKALLHWQSESILDFAQISEPDGPPSLLLLEPNRLTLLQRDADAWTTRGSAPIQHSRPWPRDLRGHLSISAGSFEAFLPGIVCAGSLASVLSIECHEAPSLAWSPAGNTLRSFAADRNYFAAFTIVARGSRVEVPASYSMAANSIDGNSYWLLAGIDSETRLFRETIEGGLSLGRWGDEIASIVLACSAGWDVLATGTGDWSEPDHLQSYEISGSNATPVGQPLEFAGPIVALWPSNGDRSVRVVSRNLETGMYEASVVLVSCGE